VNTRAPISNANSNGEIMTLVREFWLFMRERKKWWLMPIVIVMVLVGALLVFAQGSALAPFIYTIF
jgi:hypothetical protein